MKLSLRDLFWLVLAVASLAAWGIEHRKAAEDLRAWRMRSWLVRERNPQPSPEDRQRIAAAAQLGILADEELEKFFASVAEDQRVTRVVEYEPCLQELARRGMNATLLKHYEEIMEETRQPDKSRLPRNLEVLTALRRSQEKPDPLQIIVAVGDAPKTGTRAPLIYATRTNVDAGRESIGLVSTDFYLRRNGHWFVTLADEKGRQVARSHYLLRNRGGLHQWTALPYGARVRDSTELDLRRYVAPPKSGKYQLQVLYHNERNITDQQNLTGLVVSQSDPIWVNVHNPNDSTSHRWTRAPHPAVAILAACGLLAGMSLTRPLSISGKVPRRDLVWAGLVVAVALAFWFDSNHQGNQIRRLVPDADTRWTISLADKP